jgi:transcriptional regulator NrdR family protein
MLGWLKGKESEQLGEELAVLVLELMPADIMAHASRRQSKANYTKEKMQKRLEKYCTTEKLNFYKIAKMVNGFKWKLKDENFDQAMSEELATWLTSHLAVK